MPDPSEAITTQTLLATVMLDDPPATVDEEAATLTLAAADPVMAVADGIAAWYRALDGDGAWVMDTDAREAGSGAVALFDSTTIYADGRLTLLSGQLAES